jgi:microcystin-dependent protein
MSTTPNMNLQLPSVTVTEGPEWASDLNEALQNVDDHDHTSGKGKKVPVAGLDINQDLSMEDYRLTDVGSVKLEDKLATITGASNANSLHVVNGNVYFTNSGGIPVQITDGNAIVSSVIVPGNPLMPVGALLDYAGPTVPIGFLECDGSDVSRATYSDLFNVIGTSYGVGDGVFTFTLPNAAGRTTVARGTYTDSVLGSVTRTITQMIGAAAHILTSGEMPSHTHTQDAHGHTIYGGGGGGASLANNQPVLGALSGALDYTNVVRDSTAVNQNTGGGGSHNNMQPSLVVLKLIKY